MGVLTSGLGHPLQALGLSGRDGPVGQVRRAQAFPDSEGSFWKALSREVTGRCHILARGQTLGVSRAAGERVSPGYMYRGPLAWEAAQSQRGHLGFWLEPRR